MLLLGTSTDSKENNQIKAFNQTTDPVHSLHRCHISYKIKRDKSHNRSVSQPALIKVVRKKRGLCN